jgi:hypothetical protein
MNTTETAAKLGTEAGQAAASWVFDGNTTQATYLHVLTGIIEGDPEVLDAYSAPNLSGGEWGDELNDAALAAELSLDPAADAEALDEAANAYNDAASEAFWHTLEADARQALDMPTSGRYLVAYFNDLLHSGTSPEHFPTLAAIKAEMRKRYSAEDAGQYVDAYEASGDEPWLEAQKFAGVGVPFDGIDYRLTVGPRGGIATERG